MPKKLIYLLVILSLFWQVTTKCRAQTPPNPQTWQTGATGLKTQTDSSKSTGGLSYIVTQETKPHLYFWPGVINDGGWIRAGNVDLGQINVPGTTMAYSSETADWAGNTLTFTANSSPVKVFVSRLTPALAIQTSNPTVELLTGTLATNTISGTAINTGSATVYPKMIAYNSTTGVKTLQLGTTPITIGDWAATNPWLLIWYGKNSPFLDSKLPLSYEGMLTGTDAYQADSPILFRFQNLPTTIARGPNGGINLTFPAAAGLLTFLPLYGRAYPAAATTDGWTSLPQTVIDRANWWANRMCSFPQTVAETYAYDPASDKVTATETITPLTVCGGGIPFAPLPPMMGIAKDVLPLTFSAALQTANAINTIFGPVVGFDNLSAYSWSLSGLNRYVTAKRINGSGTVPSQLTTKLNTEIQQVVNDGHYAPWVFSDNLSMRVYRGDLYWGNPADTLFHLVEVADSLDTGTIKQSLIGYLQTERANYPPETVFKLNPRTGKVRGAYSYLDGDTDCYYSPTNSCGTSRTDVFSTQVPIYSLYPLDRYYALTGEVVTNSLMTTVNNILDNNYKEMDWATGYWFKDKDDRHDAVVNLNRAWSGILGYVRLAQKANNTAASQLGMALLAKVTVAKIGSLHYPRYLYGSGVSTIPSDPAWQPKNHNDVIGLVYNFNWTGPMEDARQMAILNQFRAMPNDSTAYWYNQPFNDNEIQPMSKPGSWNNYINSPRLIGYQQLTPELGLFLQDYAKNEALIYARKIQAYMPTWYLAFKEAELGSEHNLAFPIDSFQVFTAKAWIEQDTAANLKTYTDIPWLQNGDLFYIQKLSETVKAYKGWTWNVGPVGPPPSPTPMPSADFNHDGVVDYRDFLEFLPNFNQTNNTYKFVGTGLVNIFDLNKLVSLLFH